MKNISNVFITENTGSVIFTWPMFCRGIYLFYRINYAWDYSWQMI